MSFTILFSLLRHLSLHFRKHTAFLALSKRICSLFFFRFSVIFATLYAIRFWANIERLSALSHHQTHETFGFLPLCLFQYDYFNSTPNQTVERIKYSTVFFLFARFFSASHSLLLNTNDNRNNMNISRLMLSKHATRSTCT